MHSRFRLPGLLLCVSLLGVARAFAAEGNVTGRWHAEFDTQVGLQKYVFVLEETEGRITGTAIGERAGKVDEVTLTEGRRDGAEITFVENLVFHGAPLRIEYRGRLQAEDQLALTRNVANVVTEQLVATRVARE